MASLVLIFCAVLCPAFVQGNDYCNSANRYLPSYIYRWQYSTLYSKLEESLLSNKTLLDHMAVSMGLEAMMTVVLSQ